MSEEFNLKFSDGVGTLLKFIFNDLNLWRLVSRSMFSGVWVLLSCVCPRDDDDENKLRALLPLLLLLKLSIGCDVLVLMLFDLWWWWNWYDFWLPLNKLCKKGKVSRFRKRTFFSLFNYLKQFYCAFYCLSNSPFFLKYSTAAMCSLPIHWVLRLGMWQILAIITSDFVLARTSFVVTWRGLLFRWISSTTKSINYEKKW